PAAPARRRPMCLTGMVTARYPQQIGLRCRERERGRRVALVALTGPGKQRPGVVGRARPPQSARSPAFLMTLDHFPLSALKNALHSAGELPPGRWPMAASSSLTSGAARLATIRRLSSATISFGAPAGATTAVHVLPSTSGKPASAMVGISGRVGERV